MASINGITPSPTSPPTNYRRLSKEKEPIQKNEIRVTSKGIMLGYLEYARRLFEEQKEDFLVIKATGNAITKAVNVAEEVKRRFRDLHQITTIGSTKIVDLLVPIEGSNEKEVKHERTVSFLDILLSKSELDVKNPGYQAPLGGAGGHGEVQPERQLRRNKPRGPRANGAHSQQQGSPEDVVKQQNAVEPEHGNAEDADAARPLEDSRRGRRDGNRGNSMRRRSRGRPNRARGKKSERGGKDVANPKKPEDSANSLSPPPHKE